MSQPRHNLRTAAVGVRTENMRAVLVKRSAARRAHGRTFYFALARPVYCGKNLGNNVVASTDKNSTARADFFPHDIRVIIESRTADRGAAKLNGLEHRERRKLSRPAHLPPHFFQHGGGFFRLELVSDRPSRKFIRIAELIAQRKIVDLDDHTVDIEIESVAVDSLDFSNYFIYVRRNN